MKLVIDIPEGLVCDGFERTFTEKEKNILIKAIGNGTPLPKGCGDLIDRKLVLSDDGLCEFHRYDDYVKMRNYLKSIPTIIEADGGDENECHY